MPIFDWTRTDLFHPVGDGSTALFYQKDLIQNDYKGMANYILEFTEKYNMTFPGWEPERMAKLDELFKPTPPSPRRSCGITSSTSSSHHAHLPRVRHQDGDSSGRSPMGHLRPAPSAG